MIPARVNYFAMTNVEMSYPGLHTSNYLIVIVALFYSCVSQADTITLTNNTQRLSIGEYIEFLEDPQRKLTIKDVSSPAYANEFHASPGQTPNFGYTHSALWLRFTVKNNSPDNEEWYLVQQNPDIHFLDLYIPQDDGNSFKHKKSGILLPYLERDIVDRRLVFSLPLSTGAENTFYLKVTTKTSKSIDLNIWEPKQFIENSKWDSLFYGGFYGILLIMFFYNAVLYIFLRDSTYKWLISYIAVVFGAAFFYHGHAQSMFSADTIGLTERAIPLFVALLNITLLKFTEVFLSPSTDSIILQRIHTYLLYLSLIALLFVPFTDYYTSIHFLSVITIVALSFCLFRSVYSLKRSDTSARWYTLAWIIMLVSVILKSLSNFNFIPVNSVTAYGYLFGIVWMVLFMSIALADRFNKLKISVERSQHALDESETQRQLIMKAGKLGTWLWDIPAEKVQWSAETEEIFGLNKGDFKGTYDEYIKLVHPDDMAYVQQTVENTLKSHTPYYIEHRIKRVDGEERWINAFGKLDLDDQNRPLRMHGTVQDITEYKHAQEELRDSERNYQHLFNSAADGFVIRTLDGVAIDANPAVCEMYGYGKEEYLNLPLKKIAHPDSIPLYQQFRDAISQGRPFFSDEAKGIRRDGSMFYLQVQANVIQYQGKPHAFIVLRDITKHKRLQDAIKHIASGVATKTGISFFQQLVIHLAEVYQSKYAFVGMLDKNEIEIMQTTAVCCNGKIIENISYNLQGTPCANVVGQQPCAYPENVQRLFPEDHLLEVMQAKSYIGSPLFDSKGDPLGILVIIDEKPRPDISDLTELLQIFAARAAAEIERMHADELLQTRKHHLEEIVAARTAELTAVNKELESFSYSVSHDLRAPLRSIDGFSQALLEDFGESLNEEGNDYLRRIRNNAQKMAQLIDDLLQLSRVTRKDIVIKRINLSELVNDSFNKCIEHEQRQDITINIASDLITNGDPDLMSVVIDNLVSNAWKYTRNTKQAQIEFGAINNKNKVSYYIKDNGAGFDMQYADKLFNAFQRLHSPEEFEGTGIGLATVARIIQRHGGHVWAEGSVGNGAAFYFDLHAKRNSSPH